MTSLENLKRVLGPPEHPANTGNEEAWSGVESRLGVRLPDDYKAFVSMYGSGVIDDFLYVAVPFGGDPFYNLEQLVRLYAKIDGDLRSLGLPFRYLIYPKPGGLLPWAKTANGDRCYWRTAPRRSADEWTVIVIGSDVEKTLQFCGSMTEFLRSYLVGETTIDFWPDAQRAAGPRFTPLHT